MDKIKYIVIFTFAYFLIRYIYVIYFGIEKLTSSPAPTPVTLPGLVGTLILSSLNLTKISVDTVSPANNLLVIMAIDTGGNIYYVDNNTNNWKNITGNLSYGLVQVSYSNGKAFGIDKTNTVYYTPTYNSAFWYKVPTIQLINLSYDGYANILAGITNTGSFIYANVSNITSTNLTITLNNIATPSSTKTPSSTNFMSNLIQVAYSNNNAMLLNSAGVIYNLSIVSGLNTNVTIPSGVVPVQVCYDNVNVVTIILTTTGSLYYTNETTWTGIPVNTVSGTINNISILNKQIFALNKDGHLWYNNNYNGGNWISLKPNYIGYIQPNGSIKSVACSGNCTQNCKIIGWTPSGCILGSN